MTPRAYYNEWDPFAAAWLRGLIRDGLVMEGDVDERSITEVSAGDLDGYTQCHFFAGVGGWPLALSLAGWPAARNVWTASLPCQPFSSAGNRQGFADERHLWPIFNRLVEVCRPDVIFGEQVASYGGLEWIAGVRADLEGKDYAVGSVDLSAAGVGSPTKRQRLYWVADAGRVEPVRRGAGFGQGGGADAGAARADAEGGKGWGSEAGQRSRLSAGVDGYDDGRTVGDTGSAERSDEERRRPCHPAVWDREPTALSGADGRTPLDDATSDGTGHADDATRTRGDRPDDGISWPAGSRDTALVDAEGGASGPGVHLPARESDTWGGGDLRRAWFGDGEGIAYVVCDERRFGRGFIIRRVSPEPSAFPLAPRISPELGRRLTGLGVVGSDTVKAARRNRAGRLKGYGNAIVPEDGALFIRAWMEHNEENGGQDDGE